MQQYKIAFLDRLKVAIAIRDFEGADDAAALAHAETLCAGHTIEVTQAGRWVGEIQKKGRVVRVRDKRPPAPVRARRGPRPR